MNEERHAPPEPLISPEYLVTRAQEALAHDHRTLELGLDVAIRGTAVFVNGSVASEPRRVAVAEVVGKALPDLIVHNHVIVTPTGPPAADEHIE